MKTELTERQREIYDYIADFVSESGYSPSMRDISRHFGISSTNGVMCHLDALEKKGWITRKKHISRAIQLVETPMSAAERCRLKRAFTDGFVSGELEHVDETTRDYARERAAEWFESKYGNSNGEAK